MWNGTLKIERKDIGNKDVSDYPAAQLKASQLGSIRASPIDRYPFFVETVPPTMTLIGG